MIGSGRPSFSPLYATCRKLPVSKLLWAGFYKLTGNEEAMRDTLIP
jgi:hypothetical protein